MAIGLIWAALMLAAPVPLQAQAHDTGLDFLVGDWLLFDRSGKQVGTSKIVMEFPGSMLLETREADGQPAQPLWFENAEAEGGWVQLFVGPGGKMRMFKPLSAPGVWPKLLGSSVTLQDGTAAQFRMTMTHPDPDLSDRKLEISRDGGASWSTVFDYRYRRKS